MWIVYHVTIIPWIGQESHAYYKWNLTMCRRITIIWSIYLNGKCLQYFASFSKFHIDCFIQNVH